MHHSINPERGTRVTGAFGKALVLAGGAIVAVLSGYDAAAAYYRAHALDPVPAIFAGDADIALQRHEHDLFFAGGKSPDAATIHAIAARVLARDPLNPQAMFMLGVSQALRTPGGGAAQYLLAERISRRHIPNETALIATYAQHRDIDSIVRCFDRIFSVSPELVAAMMPALIASLSDPATRHSFAAYAQRPWMSGLIEVALDHAVDLDAIATLIDAIERAPPLDHARQANSAHLRIRLLSKSLASGDYAFAQGQLQRLAPASRDALAQLGFAGATISAEHTPFGWTLTNDARQSATLADDGGLAITMAAEQTGVVAERITLMPAGRYILSQRVVYAAGVPRAALVWDLLCAGQAGVFWHQPVPTRPGQTRYQTALALPPSCPVQHWSLRAVGDIGQTTSQAVLRDLALVRQ